MSERRVLNLSAETLKKFWHNLIHGPVGGTPTSRGATVIRGGRIVVLVLVAVMTASAVLLVAGAWRNDLAIESDMGVAAAEVLSAGPRRSTIAFVTPDRVTYRPELGVLYPSELDTGMRIYVEYNRSNPDLVRVQGRNASLAIIPALSVAVASWLVAAAALFVLGLLEKRITQRATTG